MLLKQQIHINLNNFIFDIFEHFDNMLILNVKRKDEFAPIKSFTRHYTPDNAIKLYLKVKNKNI